MRLKLRAQYTIFDQFAEHQIGQELRFISTLLDAHPEIYNFAANELIRVCQATGREGLSVESIVRCAVLKQYRQLSYEELAFYLEDSKSFEAFARLAGKIPKKSSLQKTISLISGTTWERINRELLKYALIQKIEDGKKTRTDSTVTETHIHYPTDSSLLFDAVRVMIRLLKNAEKISSTPIHYKSRLKRAKKRARSIPGKQDIQRNKLYRDLIKITEEELIYLQQAKQTISTTPTEKMPTEKLAALIWMETVCHYEPLIIGIIDQAKRRILKGEKVPAQEKIFSLFESHTDIIAKGNREIQYGHKLNLTSGKSGLILDAVIESGNPTDSSRAIPMLKRQKEIYGFVPEQSSMDGGYASTDNLTEAKCLGVKNMVFHKRRGLTIEEMVKSKWVYRQLRNFRAGIEANISWLKRSYGLSRCNWKGLEKFKSYVWSSIVSYNLVILARLTPALE